MAECLAYVILPSQIPTVETTRVVGERVPILVVGSRISVDAVVGFEGLIPLKPTAEIFRGPGENLGGDVYTYQRYIDEKSESRFRDVTHWFPLR